MNRFLFVLVFLLANYKTAIGCDCSYGDLNAAYFNEYGRIFSGVLISEIYKPAPGKIRVAIYVVTKAYRGVREGDTVRVFDMKSISSCGLGTLHVGRYYLIFARDAFNGIYTSKCTRTTIIPLRDEQADSAFSQQAISFGNAELSGGSQDSLNGSKVRKYQWKPERSHYHTDTAFLNKHLQKLNQIGPQRFYDSHGKPEAEGSYVNGQPEGIWTYYNGGKLYERGKYKQGKKDSLWLEWGMDTVLREFNSNEWTFKELLVTGGKILPKCVPLPGGKYWVEYNYYGNGRVRYRAQALPPQRDSNGRLREPRHHGPFRMFTTKGNVLQAGRDSFGLEVGHWIYYYANGPLRMEGDYQVVVRGGNTENQKTGVWRIYHPNGRIKASGSYHEGEKAADWKYFDANGRPIPAPDLDFLKVDEDWFTYSGD
jgi:antitoxin component YwqK of YwqJK toxin-antitoxin module